MEQGLPTKHPLARKLWQVSRILGSRSPFDQDLLAHTEAQLDFILEMYAGDNPEAAKFTRPGQSSTDISQAKLDAAWERVLVGSAKAAMMKGRMPSAAVQEILRQRQERIDAMKRHSVPHIRMGPGAKG